MFGWLALAPLLAALDRQPTGRGFLLGLTAGFVYFGGTLYWISRVMAVYGGLPTPAAIFINVMLVAYLALYPAVFGLAMARLTRLGGTRLLLVAPLVWVAAEYGRAYLLTGFPWVLLGYSQVTVLPIAQFASIVGVFGMSGLTAAIGSALAVGALQQARHGARAYLPLAVTLAVLLALAGWGTVRMARGALMREGEAVRVGVVQGNVDQADKVLATRSAQVFRDYLDMTRQAILQGAQLVVWPESATPFYFGEDAAAAEQIRSLARQAQVPILLGSDQIERGRPPTYYNSAFLVGADGADAGVYQKMHLVPFGEYVPAKRLFFFMSRLVEAVSDFSPGRLPTLLSVASHRISTSICYEVVYPDLVRRFVRDGSELLSTMTNDAWFGRTSAPYQHFTQASMRAIESGRYLVRAANTGISGFVDPYGHVLQATGIFEPAVVVGDVRYLTSQTIYTRVGDVFAYASLATTVALLALVRRRVQ